MKHEDKEFATEVAKMIENSGFKVILLPTLIMYRADLRLGWGVQVWIDTQIRAGKDWRNEIAQVTKSFNFLSVI